MAATGSALRKRRKTAATTGGSPSKAPTIVGDIGGRKKHSVIKEVTGNPWGTTPLDPSKSEFPTFKKDRKSGLPERITTSNGDVEIPKGRYPTMYQVMATNSHNKLDVNGPSANQGPHTLSHVLVDHLFAEQLMAKKKIVKENILDIMGKGNAIPPVEVVTAIVDDELGSTKLSDKAKKKLNRWQRYYKALYDETERLANGAGTDEEAIASARALMELHPYSTRAWKQMMNGRSSNNVRNHGEGMNGNSITNMSIENIKKNIDLSSSFNNKAELEHFMESRLRLGLPQSTVDQVFS
jgi:hypothetical protein